MRQLLLALLLAAPLPAADLVLRNGKIVTLDAGLPETRALAITDGKITALGAAAEREITTATRVIDLRGRLAIPGFIEGHGHFMGLGESRMRLNLRRARSWEDIVGMVAGAAKEAKPGEWILGSGWHQEKWNQKPEPNIGGFPLEESLSRVSPNNPVALRHESRHAVFANRAALARIGITPSTPDPAGGQIVRDPQGNPTGLLNEKAQFLAEAALDRDLARLTAAEREAGMHKAVDLAAEEILANGITTFHDAGANLAVIGLIKERARKGTLPLRLYMMVREPTAELPKAERLIGFANDFLTVRAIKRQIDGAVGTRTAWFFEPYADMPDSRGINIEGPKDIEATANFAIEHGFQLAVHAVGDRANQEVLNMYDRVFRAHPGAKNLRWRIEHAQNLRPTDIPRFARMGVIAAMQGVHATSDAPMVIPRLGAKRAQEEAYLWRSLFKAGAHVANGTDVPVEEINPIASFYASVTRRTAGGLVFYPAQRMTRMEALRSYTVENAYAAFEEDRKGTLKVGMLGDVTVLSQDILTVPEAAIPTTQIDYTIVGGKVVWERERGRR